MATIQMNEKIQEAYKSLAKRETRIHNALASIYNGHTRELQDIVAYCYQICTDKNGRVDYTRLNRNNSVASKIKLKMDAQEVAQTFPDSPASILNFDNLNMTQVLSAQFLISELKTAEITYKVLRKHLWDWGCDLFPYFEEWLVMLSNPRVQELVQELFNTSRYPLLETVQGDAVQCAYRMDDLLITGLVRGDDLQKTMKTVTEYAKKREMTDADKTMKTNGTYITMGVTKDVLEEAEDEDGEHARYFHSVIADEAACELCKDIETEQEEEPIPISQMEPWVNAPPFHPYCRCGIEVIWQ